MDQRPVSDLGIGAPIKRVEDLRLLRGRGHYVDDLRDPQAAHMVVLRSPHAAARIVRIDTKSARSLPGVLDVFTAEDLERDGIGGLKTSVARQKRDGSPMPRPPYRALALGHVHFAGDPVAAVVAETRAIAQDASELIEVVYEDQPAVTDVVRALEPGAPSVWPELCPDNLCFVFELGNKAAVADAFARAHHITRLDFRVSRVTANTMEPRNAVGSYDPVEESFTLLSGMQSPHKIRSELAEFSLHVPQNHLRAISPDVGGGFGMKGSPYPEQILVLYAAKRLGRTVTWNASRSESFLADYHARDNVSTVELALDDKGIFLGLRIKTLANLGAYLAFNTPHPPTGNLGGLAGVYRTPAIHAEVLGVFTNTQPMAPYRGAGRPEATFALERVIDLAADEIGVDRVDLRRRNLITPEAMPFRTGLVFTYDCGDFGRNMDLALKAADWEGFPARRAEAAKRGKLRGFGIANAIEVAAGPHRAPGEEGAEIRFDPGGTVTLLLGSHNHGQGHETAFRQIAHSLLGIDPANVRVISGDTDLVSHGRGTFGSRSIVAAGTALSVAAQKIIARGKTVAAHLLEASEADIEFAAGRFTVVGTDRGLRIEDVARASFEPARLPRGAEVGMNAAVVITPDEATFPNGCHACEVEVDPDTGVLDVVSYVVADDVGTVINPVLVHGQIHGGVAQGLGQALGEAIHYDDTGQMRTASFMDYVMPHADDLPSITVLSNPVPTTKNPLGAKGAGEAGTVGALPCVINAVVDALKPLGIRHLDMPASPEQVWCAIRKATH